MVKVASQEENYSVPTDIEVDVITFYFVLFFITHAITVLSRLLEENIHLNLYSMYIIMYTNVIFTPCNKFKKHTENMPYDKL